ncbi:MAG: outer membrane protein assembly factor, partial [Flavobacteriaceae bacterium]
MRTRGYFAVSYVKIGLLSIGVFFASCNSLKRVGENELLLTKNNIFADELKVKDQGIESLIVQEPNSTVLGFPMRLNIYNLAKVNPDSSYRAWLHRKEKREKRLTNFLSGKQVNRLGESFLVKGYSEWLKKIGESPIIIDTARARRSTNRLSAYYDSKGYFNNRAYYEIMPAKKPKRAEVNYRIELGKPYIVDSISSRVSSTVID